MSRILDTRTLDAAAADYAAHFLRDSVFSETTRKAKPPSPTRPWLLRRIFHSGAEDEPEMAAVAGREWVMQNLYNLTFKDEFDHLVEGVKAHLGPKPLAEFEALAAKRFGPRSDRVFGDDLRFRLAVDPNGNHVHGAIGRVEIGRRFVGMRRVEVEHPGSIRFRKWARDHGVDPGSRQTWLKTVPVYWPVYAGETEERLAGSPAPDPLPEGADPWPVTHAFALNTRISNECALLACDAVVDNLDEGTGAAVIQGRTGAQPADPDTAATGTLLFTLACSDPAFGDAADAAPGGQATASAITDDSSADATGMLGYCRASSTNDGATPLDDHIDGEAGTSGSDFNFNTVSIVAGATVSLTSWTVTMPES